MSTGVAIGEAAIAKAAPISTNTMTSIVGKSAIEVGAALVIATPVDIIERVP